MTFFRSDQAACFVTFTGVTGPSTTWSSMTGGDNVAPSTPLHPGGMKPMINLGGFPTRSDMTLKRPWSDALFGLHKYLDNNAGNVPCKMTVVALDNNGKVVPGSDRTYTGLVLNSMQPDVDSKTNSEGEYTIVVGPDGPMT